MVEGDLRRSREADKFELPNGAFQLCPLRVCFVKEVFHIFIQSTAFTNKHKISIVKICINGIEEKSLICAFLKIKI